MLKTGRSRIKLTLKMKIINLQHIWRQICLQSDLDKPLKNSKGPTIGHYLPFDLHILSAPKTLFLIMLVIFDKPWQMLDHCYKTKCAFSVGDMPWRNLKVIALNIANFQLSVTLICAISELDHNYETKGKFSGKDYGGLQPLVSPTFN